MKLLLMTLIVAKVAFSVPEPAIEDVQAKFDEAGIQWNAIDKVNWPDYPYKPEVEFRIMHSETEIYLQFHVKENGARATYDYDFGGSPYNAACRLVISNESYGIVTGVSMPMLIEIISAQMADDGSDIKDVMAKAVEAGRNGAQTFHASSVADEEEDEL